MYFSVSKYVAGLEVRRCMEGTLLSASLFNISTDRARGFPPADHLPHLTHSAIISKCLSGHQKSLITHRSPTKNEESLPQSASTINS